MRGGGQHASQPGQVTVADELVPGHSEGAQAGRRLEGAAPQGRDVVVGEGAVLEGEGAEFESQNGGTDSV